MSDGGHIEPHLLLLDLAGIGEINDVKEAERKRAPLALEAERSSLRPAPPERFVDEEVVAIKAPDRRDFALRQVGEQALIKRPRSLATAELPERRSHDVVDGIGSQGGEDTVDERQKGSTVLGNPRR